MHPIPSIKNTHLRGALARKKILFVMHTRITTFLELFRDFTAPKCDIYTIIDHPLYPSMKTQSRIYIYKKGNMQKCTSISSFSAPYTFNFLKDFFLTLIWVFKTDMVYDVAFGANNLNALSLLLLKKLGKVKRVVFISIDYTPSRYDNPILNKIYHLFDRICCYSVDVIWNSSGRMNEARVKNGLVKKKISFSIVTPDGSYFDSKKRLPLDKIDRKKIVFLGHMRPVMGVELILEGFREIIKEIPDANLLLIGGGPNLEEYKKLAMRLGLKKNVSFTGFIKRHEDVDDLMCTGAIGLAPFVPDKTSYEYYSDVGKPKAYLAAGMPVVITKVPEIAEEIENKKAGIAINYSKKELVYATIKLLNKDKLYKKYRKNAIALSRKYAWPNIFTNAFKITLDYFSTLNEKEKIFRSKT